MGLMGTLCALAVGKTGVYLVKFEMDLYFKTIEKYKVRTKYKDCLSRPSNPKLPRIYSRNIILFKHLHTAPPT